MRKHKTNPFTNKLYKGAVTGLVGFTLLTGGYFAYLTFSFVHNSKLSRKERELSLQDQLMVDGAKELSN